MFWGVLVGGPPKEQRVENNQHFGVPTWIRITTNKQTTTSSHILHLTVSCGHLGFDTLHTKVLRPQEGVDSSLFLWAPQSFIYTVNFAILTFHEVFIDSFSFLFYLFLYTSGGGGQGYV